MMLPSIRLLWIGTALLGAAVAASIFGYREVWVALAGLLLASALIDALLALRLPAPALARRVPHSLALGVRT